MLIHSYFFNAEINLWFLVDQDKYQKLGFKSFFFSSCYLSLPSHYKHAAIWRCFNLLCFLPKGVEVQQNQSVTWRKPLQPCPAVTKTPLRSAAGRERVSCLTAQGKGRQQKPLHEALGASAGQEGWTAERVPARQSWECSAWDDSSGSMNSLWLVSWSWTLTC